MKLGANTLIWGNRVQDLARVLDVFATHGCEGVEFSQRPEQLGDPAKLADLLSERSLTLLGLSGGTVEERIKFCDSVLKPRYLYVDEWNENEATAAKSAGLALAIHPHIFRPAHRLVDIDVQLREHPDLLFLPDVAHLTITGDSPSNAVIEWCDRLAGIHIKDWKPVYGRSSHRYARGFVELGKGIVDFDKLFEALRTIRYQGWLIFEQGNREVSPEEVVVQSARWLGRRMHRMRKVRGISLGALPTVDHRGKEVQEAVRRVRPSLERGYTLEDKKRFLESVLRITRDDPRSLYPRLAEAVCRLLKARLVILCSHSPAADLLGVIGVYPPTEGIGHHFLGYHGSLSGVALERQAITIFDLTKSEPGAPYGQPMAKFGYPSLIQRLGLEELISVPVIDWQNPHQARFSVNVFPNARAIHFDEDELAEIGELIVWAADVALDERCAIGAAGASLAASYCQQSDAFLNALRDLLLETLECDALTIFLVDDTGTRLEAAISTGICWAVPAAQQFYREGEGVPGTIWRRREALICPDPPPRRTALRRSDEAKPNGSPSLLCAPMLDAAGGVIGVIRCQNKRAKADALRMFSDDDVAVLDAVCRAAVPHLQVLISKERRSKALRRLTHELNNPLVAIGGAVDRMRRELERRTGTSELSFSEDYFGDIESWLGLMRGLLNNADVLRLVPGKLELRQQRVHLYGDVFMPAVQQIQQILLDREFDPKAIVIRKFEEIPRLWLDKNRMNQVVFNLLTNAIKYAFEEAKRFKVMVVGRETETHHEIDFCDWGAGVQPELKEAIFLEGVRSKGAEQSNVSGDGLGLWIARQIVEAHGGEIKLIGFHDPTVFRIFLPKWLSSRKTCESNVLEP